MLQAQAEAACLHTETQDGKNQLVRKRSQSKLLQKGKRIASFRLALLTLDVWGAVASIVLGNCAGVGLEHKNQKKREDRREQDDKAHEVDLRWSTSVYESLGNEGTGTRHVGGFMDCCP